MLTSSAVNPEVYASGLAPCTHEETDSCMLLHLEDAVKEGYTKVVVRTVELAVTAAQRLDITEMWVTFWNWKSFRYLAAHAMAGPDCCTALPMFHAFTGCDTVSLFSVEARRVHGIH